MIVEWIWAQICAFLGWILDKIPTFTLPDWSGDLDLDGYLADGLGAINGMHNWLPLAAMVNCILFLLLVGATAFAVRVVRILQSTFTGGGGGAA